MTNESTCIYYKEGYKYQLTEIAFFKTKILGYVIHTDFISLGPNGLLLIKKGYAWDGPSGPTIDTPDSMRASLAHDACYQLMRMELIPITWRRAIDKELKRRLIEDGMNELRADIWYVGVCEFAEDAALPESRKKDIKAP